MVRDAPATACQTDTQEQMWPLNTTFKTMTELYNGTAVDLTSHIRLDLT